MVDAPFVPSFPILSSSFLISVVHDALRRPHVLILYFLCATSLLVLYYFLACFRTRRFLERRCHLPTVVWLPKFWNGGEGAANPVRPSSITRILPRMYRLCAPSSPGGPLRGYGAYATIYGRPSSVVVHVAHPVPARLLLGATGRSFLPASQGVAKSPGYDHFRSMFGRGLFTAEAEDGWRRQRAGVAHALLSSPPGEGPALDRLAREAHLAADAFLAAADHALPVLDVAPLLQRATAGIIYRYLTRAPFPDAPPDAPSLGRYLGGVNALRTLLLAKARSAWSLLPAWCRARSSAARREREHVAVVRHYAAAALRAARPGSPLRNIAEAYAAGPKRRGRMDPVDEAVTLLFAGQDTAAATLAWACHLLSLHPEAQARLRRELEGARNGASSEEKKEDGDCARLDRTRVGNLPYLDAVIKESLRLYPVAPFVVRRVQADLRLPDSDAVVPEGALACVWIYGLHRHRDLWKKPHDFRPSRWTEEERDEGRKRGAYMPFAAGPRNCVGQVLGNLVLRIMLARIVEAYEMVDVRLGKGDHGETPNVQDLLIEMQAGFTVLPEGGVRLQMRRRGTESNNGEGDPS